MSGSARIVIVDDDEHIRELASLYLQKEGFDITCVSDGTTAAKQILQANANLVVLDLTLPGQSGYDVCKQVRQDSDIPIIMLTARDEDIDKILGLELGADDYLRTKEFDLLATLAENSGIVLTREQLLDRVWGYNFYGETRTVDVHVQHVRAHLVDSGLSIVTVRGVGYKLVEDAARKDG